MPEVKDEYAGQGGSYILDPATGVRTLVHRTDMNPAPEVAPTAPAANAPETATNPQG